MSEKKTNKTEKNKGERERDHERNGVRRRQRKRRKRRQEGGKKKERV